MQPAKLLKGPWQENQSLNSNYLLSPKQTVEIPLNTDLKKWPRCQPDMALIEWMADNIDGDILGRAHKLMTASMRQVPAGTLPDDDKLLSRWAGYSAGRIAAWHKVKDRVMDGVWFKRASDGRWQCGVLTEGITDYLSKRDVQPRRRPSNPAVTLEDDGAPF
ncbi:MAG: hypothetical protein WDN02_05235 [Methylovirgula sp.]|uniref:hypothetical protein n=1 Tax=Methylovirgula sp. TaxID=1978224 RepID=UPI00307648F8